MLTTSSYALQWMVTLPLEIVAASITLQYWPGAQDTNPAAWVTIFLVVIIAINFFGVRGYGEAEFVFSIIKILAVVGFILLGIIINCGGGPNGVHYGTEYWDNPGAFNHGFKGLCSVFTTAAFSFGGTELVGLAAAESQNPRVTLPKAVKQVFWRILLVRLVPKHEPEWFANTHTVLYGLFDCRRYLGSLRRPKFARFFIFRRKCLPLRHCSAKCWNCCRAQHYECCYSDCCPLRRQLVHLRR